MNLKDHDWKERDSPVYERKLINEQGDVAYVVDEYSEGIDTQSTFDDFNEDRYTVKARKFYQPEDTELGSSMEWEEANEILEERIDYD